MTCFLGGAAPGGPSTSSAQATGSASAAGGRATPIDPGQMGDQRRADRAMPAQRLVQHGRHRVANRRIEALDGVDRTEDLLERAAVILELEADVLVLPDQPVAAAGQAVPIDLVAVAEAGWTIRWPCSTSLTSRWMSRTVPRRRRRGGRR